MEEKLRITPKTKVLQLIESFPQLETLLVEMVPVFIKLKNPILRKTVAKITTLQQAASIGGINAEVLINRLRNEVGQDGLSEISDSGYVVDQPDWMNVSKIVKGFDIRDMLHQGEQPVNMLIAELRNLQADEIYQVSAPFVPAPLIDKAISLQINHWINKIDSELVEVYFMKE